ncbi:Nepenthesin [Bertholletia excelsa]
MATRWLLSVVTVVLLVDCAVGVTFSSRLIHRFSDEVKALRVSRNGAVSGTWPKRGSLEYYHMLQSSDVHRQKMKLGPRHQLLFPSEGSKTMHLGNDFGWLHYTWIDVGTPNVSFLVALDAGSDLLWVPCDCIQCAPLSASHYDSLDKDLNEYNPSGSTTSKHLNCSHQLCELGPKCKNPKQPCPYTVDYLSEDTSSSGFLVEDTLYLAAGSGETPNGSVRAPVIIGCGRQQSGGYLDGVAPDGLMGLGLGEISVPSFLAKEGLIRNSFSLCFDKDDAGRIYCSMLQLVKSLNLTYIIGVKSCCIGGSCLDKTNFKALVDSGTSFTFLPKEAYDMVVQEFDRQVNATSTSYEGYPWQYCYKTSSQEIPSVTLKFAENNSFVVHDPVFMVSGNQGVVGFCLAIEPIDGDSGIIGQNFMTGYRMVFDREKLELGWSRSNCQDLSGGETMPLTPPNSRSPNPLPTTEQQSAPGGHAVAPAVAGRTPSPSVAASQQLLRLHLLQFLLVLLLFLHPHTSGL